MKKFLLGLLILFLCGVLGFYFYASSSFNDPMSYDKIVTFNSRSNFTSDTFSICTYNIGYLSGMTNNLPVDRSESLFSSNLSKSIDLFRAYDFDFICLQEVDFNSARSYHYNQFDSLGKYLNFYQGAYAVNWDKSYIPFPYFPIDKHFGKMFSGQGILSKVQLSSNDLIVMDKPLNAPFYYNAFYLDRILQISKVQLDTDTLVIMNVHLEAFDRVTRELQAEIVLEVFNSYANDKPVVLLGDFNSRPPFATGLVEDEKTVEIFLNSPLIDEAIPKERYLDSESDFFTFDTKEPYERLDYIFYNNNKIRKIDSDVLRKAKMISDHLPVWMEFVLISEDEFEMK